MTSRNAVRLLMIFALASAICAASSAQGITIFPQIDSLSLWGTCTPPGFRCSSTRDSAGNDRFTIRPCYGTFIRGTPSQVAVPRIDSIYFQVRDSLHQNRYSLFYTNLSSFHSTYSPVPMDTVFLAFGGLCRFTLKISRSSAVTDSAVISFTSYQTGLGVQRSDDLLPHSFLLRPPYPNPFNPSTTISYYLSEHSWVRLEAYDVCGRLLDVLVNEFQPSGDHFIHWSPQIASSAPLFLVMSAGSSQSVVKCQLLK
jgi:hypothetical protein